MTSKSEILSRFSAQGAGDPLFVPDLTAWYRWHRDRETLPDRWRGFTLVEVARDMGVPLWAVATPWKVETPGVAVSVSEKAEERILHVETDFGELLGRWTLGPDGDWWQTEYPVKTSDDLMAALEWVKAREYRVDGEEAERLVSDVGDGGVLALNIPRRPYADLLGDLLGWSDGLVLLGEPEIGEMIESLESKVQDAVRRIAPLPGDVVLSPDNLDGQFISPRVFERHLAESYRATVDTLAESGKPLVVHAGGPAGNLLRPLADAGVSGVEGICGPPQGDTTLAEARARAGPDFTLWGGIPQDALTDAWTQVQFERAVSRAFGECHDDPRIILGVADMVPPSADPERLGSIRGLLQH